MEIYFFDSFIDDSNIFDEIRELMYNIENTIALNQDLRTKNIGDIVQPWDGSSLTSIDGNDKYYVVHEPFLTGKFMVTSINEKTSYKNCISEYIQDLIITEITSKQQFRISSDHVKLVK